MTNSNAPETTQSSIHSGMYGIEGMTCTICVAKLEQGMSKLEGVSKFTVSLTSHTLHVTYDLNILPFKALQQAITDIGFTLVVPNNLPEDAPEMEQSSMQVATYAVTGMHCASCSTLLEQALQKQAGVEKATVNIVTHNMHITYDTTIFTLEGLQALVSKLGFTLVLPAISEAKGHGGEASQKK